MNGLIRPRTRMSCFILPGDWGNEFCCSSTLRKMGGSYAVYESNCDDQLSGNDVHPMHYKRCGEPDRWGSHSKCVHVRNNEIDCPLRVRNPQHFFGVKGFWGFNPCQHQWKGPHSYNLKSLAYVPRSIHKSTTSNTYTSCNGGQSFDIQMRDHTQYTIHIGANAKYCSWHLRSREKNIQFTIDTFNTGQSIVSSGECSSIDAVLHVFSASICDQRSFLQSEHIVSLCGYHPHKIVKTSFKDICFVWTSQLNHKQINLIVSPDW